MGISGARRAAERVIEELRSEHGLHLDTTWDGDTIHARGRGFTAHVEAAPRYIHVVVRLSLLLFPLRRTVEREVHDYLDRFVEEVNP